MPKSLNVILEIQELDMKMIRLIRLKKDRQNELNNIMSIKKDLHQQSMLKEGEIIELKKNVRLSEGEVAEIVARIKKLEGQQNSVKKVEEFNALSQEISAAEREKAAKEQRLSDLYDKLVSEEDILKSINNSLSTTEESSKLLEQEILESIHKINEEGKVLKEQRDELITHADSEILRVYERLLRNKKDRVVVPIENRSCSGCHIVLTAQHENLVRKGERLVFCEHCSRIHYWQESPNLDGSSVTPLRRRRRSTKV